MARTATEEENKNTRYTIYVSRKGGILVTDKKKQKTREFEYAPVSDNEWGDDFAQFLIEHFTDLGVLPNAKVDVSVMLIDGWTKMKIASGDEKQSIVVEG